MADLRPVFVATDGDVKGPASASDNYLPLFSGTTGKLLKNSGTPVTAQGRALLDDNTQAEQRTTLGLGTSATQNVMAALGTFNTTDVMQVGGGGICTTNMVKIPSGSTDFNNHNSGGNYRIDNPVNGPPGLTYALLSVIPGTDICGQTAQRHDVARFWFRGGLNGNWQGWREAVTGRPTGWTSMTGFAPNWYGAYNLGTNKQGTMINLIANIVCTSGLANFQPVAWTAHAPGTAINFIGDLLGSNGAAQAVSIGIRADGLLVYNYALGAASSPGIPSYPMGVNLNANYRMGDGGASND